MFRCICLTSYVIASLLLIPNTTHNMPSVSPRAGFRHSGGALQRHPLRTPAGWKHRRDILHRQRGSLRHLLQDSQALHAHLRRPQPPRLPHHVRSHHLFTFPWATQRWSSQACRQHGSLPTSPLLHARVRAAHVPRITDVPRSHRPRAHPADVWR